MKLKLKPLQARILVKLGTAREMPFDHLTKALMPDREMQGMSLTEWDNEIRLNIEILSVYGVIQIHDRLGVRICVAPDFVVRWADVHRVRAAAEGKKYKPSIAIPLVVAAVLATATAGCSTFPGMTQSTPAPVVKPYNADGTQPPERMEQFYNARTGSMVYRFCVGDECPLPTQKKPVQKMAVVTETNPDGTTTPVEQKAAFASADTISPTQNAAETRKAVREALSSPKTASNNAAAAALAAQLNEQRRALQAAAGVEQSPASPVAAPKLSVKTLGAGSGQAPAAAPAPAAKPSVRDNSPVLPSTGTRVPPAPSAKASVLSGATLASANAGMAREAVGGVAANVQVTETPMTSSVSETDQMVSLGRTVVVATAGAIAGAAAGIGGAVAATHAVDNLVSKAIAKATGDSSAEDFLAGWANKWSAKDADAYFNQYAKDFWPSYGQAKNPSTWEQQRRSVMVRPGAIKVDVEVVKVEEKDGKASVRFWQTYESTSFKSRVLKSLELVKADGGWKIHRERLIPVEAKASNA